MTTPAAQGDASSVLPSPPPHEDQLVGLLQLMLAQGIGPVLLGRLLERFGTPDHVLQASPNMLHEVPGIGPTRAAAILSAAHSARDAALRELELASKLSVRLIPRTSADYPSLLASLPDAPAVLYCKGSLSNDLWRYPVGIVGSRDCSAYGIEQAERFGGVLAKAGLTVVSGGARGIDSAAHRGALRMEGKSVAVLGCGLAHCYPPENRDLFERLAVNGAVVSELPLNTPPSAENFPARNRIISGLSLGILVIEAAVKSGALITARVAAEDHGREVFALPGRVDSVHSRGTLELVKQGGAQIVTDPGDVIQALEAVAHHVHQGSHAARFPAKRESPVTAQGLLPPPPPPTTITDPVALSILECMNQPVSLDEILDHTGMEASRLRSHLTVLEIQGEITREGSRFRRRSRVASGVTPASRG